MQNEILDFIQNGKGKNIALYDVSEEKTLTDFVIVQHFNSTAENKKFADAFMIKFDITTLPEGYSRGEWIIFDLDTVVVHSFVEPQREKYNLDKLWQNKKVELNNKNSKKSKK